MSVAEAKGALVGNANLFDVSADKFSGVMVAFYPAPTVAVQLAALEGVTVPTEELHITLGYAGSADKLDDEQIARVILAVRDIARNTGPLRGNINGVGRFNASGTSDAQDVIYAVVDVPGLDRLRALLSSLLSDRGVELARDHGFNPHITLAYVEPGAPFPLQTLPTTRLELGEITISVGDKRATFPLNGDMRVNEQSTEPTEPTEATEPIGNMHFVINKAGGGQTRWVERGGRRFLVAPVVTINEGVLNGELVRAAEFQKYPQTWNGRPITLGHPKQGDEHISANNQDILDAAIGSLWNVSITGNKKRGEMWLDETKCQTLGGPALMALNRLNNGEQVEVSTGYFRDLIEEAGDWHGKPYRGIAVNLRPDHLAILLDDVGACSWKDGCGAPRVNQAEAEVVTDDTDAVVVDSALQVQAASQSFISELVRNLIKTFGGSKDMGREKTIQGLAANCRCKLNKDQLEALDDSTLTALAETLKPVANEESAVADTNPAPAAVAVAPAPVAAAVAPALPQEITDFVSMLNGIGGVGKLGEALSAITANADQDRAGLVAQLVANEQCVLSEAELKGLTTPTLKRMASSFVPKNYYGNAGAFAANAGDNDAYVLEMPNPFKEAK